MTSVRFSATGVRVKPATSLSKVCTVRDCGAKREKPFEGEKELMAAAIEEVVVPSNMRSSTLSRTTVWGIFQLALVNTNEVVVARTFASVTSKLFMSMITKSKRSGCASKTTVKLTTAELPSSKSPPLRELRLKPAISLSKFGILKVCDAMEVKNGSEPETTAKTRSVLIVPSIKKSSTEERLIT